MEECKVTENDAGLHDESLNTETDNCLKANDNLSEGSDNVELVDKNCIDDSRTDRVPNNIKKYHIENEVPSSPNRNDAFNRKSVSEEYELQDSPQSIQNKLSLKEVNVINNSKDEEKPSDDVCRVELHSDFSSVDDNSEKGLFELGESCELSSINHTLNVDETHRKPEPENKSNGCELSSSHLTTCDSNCLQEELLIKDEPDTDRTYDNSDAESKLCDDHDSHLFDESLKNEISEEQDSREESHAVVGSDGSDTISGDEDLVQNSMCKEVEIITGDIDSNHNQQIENADPISSSKFNSSAEVSEPLMYVCIHCSFTDPQLEKLTSHVVTCVKKRKFIQNQELHSAEEPLSKKRVLPYNQNSSVPKPKFSVVSKTQPVVLPQMKVPIPANTRFIRGSHNSLVNSSQTHFSASSRVKIANASLLSTSPQTPITGASKTILSISPKLVSVSKPQIIINPVTQLPISSGSQITVSGQKLPTKGLKPQISIMPKNSLTSVSKMQSVITLQSQLPIMSSQLTASSTPRVITSSQSQFPLAAGTKLTLGPHSQVPIAPQAPLTLPSQGLTIAQAGSQLFITTKPVQPNASAPNQPTLLGLGIGTNPAAAPKNIVLLPNVMFNSPSASAGNANGKQTPTSVQRQIIFQTTPRTLNSVAPMQLLQNLVFATESSLGQPKVLLSPLYTIPTNLVTSNNIKSTAAVSKSVFTSGVQTVLPSNVVTTSAVLTSTSSNVPQTKMPELSLSPNSISNTSALPVSTTILKPVPVEKTGQTTKSLDKFICEICDDYVKDLDKLRNHMQCLHAIKIHPKAMPSFSCQKCQFCFFTEQGLERHLVGSHGLVTIGMQEAADKGKDGGRCPICGWGYQNKLLHHVATDHKVVLKPADLSYKCTICSSTFGVYKQFEEHVYSTHRTVITKLAQKNSKKSSPAIK